MIHQGNQEHYGVLRTKFDEELRSQLKNIVTEVDEFIGDNEPIIYDEVSFSGYKTKKVDETPVIQTIRK